MLWNGQPVCVDNGRQICVGTAFVRNDNNNNIVWSIIDNEFNGVILFPAPMMRQREKCGGMGRTGNRALGRRYGSRCVCFGRHIMLLHSVAPSTAIGGYRVCCVFSACLAARHHRLNRKHWSIVAQNVHKSYCDGDSVHCHLCVFIVLLLLAAVASTCCSTLLIFGIFEIREMFVPLHFTHSFLIRLFIGRSLHADTHTHTAIFVNRFFAGTSNLLTNDAIFCFHRYLSIVWHRFGKTETEMDERTMYRQND